MRLLLIRIVDYCTMIGLCFLALPFSYFYADEALSSEEGIDDFLDNDLSDEEDTASTRSGASKKRMGLFKYDSDDGDSLMATVMDRSYKALRHTVSIKSIH